MNDFGLLVSRMKQDPLSQLTCVDQPLELIVDDYGRLIISGRWLAGTNSWAEGDAGVSALAVRQDADGPLSGVADGEYTPLQVDELGRLRVVSDLDVDMDFVYPEDSGHSSGDLGSFSLAVRQDDEASMVDTDLDYAPFQVDDEGYLRTVSIRGDEQYTVTDALAAAGDCLETITASATPWVDVATLATLNDERIWIYGYQFAADQNVQARIVLDDGTPANLVVYKTAINGSAQPGLSEHFSEGGRIEIAGADGSEVKLQIKKRSACGGDANGTGSMHIRVTPA